MAAGDGYLFADTRLRTSDDDRHRRLVQHLVGTVLKDNPDDLKKVQHYFEHVVKKRSGPLWNRFYDARTELC